MFEEEPNIDSIFYPYSEQPCLELQFVLGLCVVNIHWTLPESKRIGRFNAVKARTVLDKLSQ